MFFYDPFEKIDTDFFEELEVETVETDVLTDSSSCALLFSLDMFSCDYEELESSTNLVKSFISYAAFRRLGMFSYDTYEEDVRGADVLTDSSSCALLCSLEMFSYDTYEKDVRGAYSCEREYKKALMNNRMIEDNAETQRHKDTGITVNTNFKIMPKLCKAVETNIPKVEIIGKDTGNIPAKVKPKIGDKTQLQTTKYHLKYDPKHKRIIDTQETNRLKSKE